MADVTLYKLLGLSKEQADEVARRVRASFSDSQGPAEWIMRLIDEFDINQERAEIFACGWFAGKYAGVSEVFQVVQREIDQMEKDQVKRAEKENKYPLSDGYA